MERRESETSSQSFLTNGDTESSVDKKKNHAAAPLTAWGKSVEIEPHMPNGHAKFGDSLGPNPKSEVESASVNDLGEAKRLYNHEEELITQPSTISQDQLDRITTGAGTQFPDSSSGLENGGSPRYPGSLQELANDVPQPISLASRLRAELKYSLAGKDGRKFLPRDKFDEILTISAVRQELKAHAAFNNASDRDLKKLTNKIYKASMTEPGNLSSATHRRKLFALLALMQMVPAIEEFIAAGIHDSDLPFIMEDNKASTEPFYCMYRWHDIRKPGPSENRIPIACFSKWQDHQIEGFYTNQWQLLAPHFELGGINIKPYNFHDNIILPFIEDTSDNWKEGGFSDVWRVKIHRAHWHTSNQRTESNNDKGNPSYAIKRLRQDNREAFDKEVEALKRFSDQNKLHLINLLLTFHYRGKYHLIFPWADGNLSSFWDEHRDHNSPRRDWVFVQWAARQWLGIAEGLQAIHKPPTRAETQDPSNPRDNGRHGDLKPENILWFKSGHRDLTDPDGFGVFVISDFGLTSFHRNETKDLVSPSHLARSPTYRPPECDVCTTISTSYDIWSFGCILLEFVIWYIRGWDGVDQASQRRTIAERPAASEAKYDFTEDKFFQLTESVIIEDDKTIEKVARLKECVKEEFASLREDGTTRFLDDLLDFVDKSLLRMRPDMRATCDEIVAKFTELCQKCSADEKYCTEIEFPKIDRKGTHNSELHASYRPTYKSVEPLKEIESNTPEPEVLDKDSADSTNRPSLKDIDRQITESPKPWESRTEIHKISSKGSLKRQPESFPRPADIATPSQTPPPRTDTNSTGEGSPSKRVSFAEKTDVRYPGPSAGPAQPPDTSELDPPGGKTVSHQHQQKQKQQKGETKNIQNKASASSLTRCDEGPDEMSQLASPTPSLLPVSQKNQDEGKQNSETITGTAAERPAPGEAQTILARGNPLIQPTPHTSSGPQSTALAPPTQSTPGTSSNTEQGNLIDSRPRSPPDLKGVSKWRLLLALCNCFGDKRG